MRRQITIGVIVTVQATVGENEVEQAINQALDEPPCDWGDWEVRQAVIITVKKEKA